MIFWLPLELAPPSLFLCLSSLVEAGRSFAYILWQGDGMEPVLTTEKKLGLPYLILFRESGQEINFFLKQYCMLNTEQAFPT